MLDINMHEQSYWTVGCDGVNVLVQEIGSEVGRSLDVLAVRYIYVVSSGEIHLWIT